MAILRVHVSGEGQPLVGEPVFGRFSTQSGRKSVATLTDDTGVAELSYPDLAVIDQVIVAPGIDWWHVVVHDAASLKQPLLRVQVPALPEIEESAWWHVKSGVNPGEPIGTDVRIGVIDTGCALHPDLRRVVRGGSSVGLKWDPDPNTTLDSEGHGTHVIGILSSDPTSVGVRGGARGATVVTIRAGSRSTQRAFAQDDVAVALGVLVHQWRCAIVNLSLGSPSYSVILEEAIEDAADEGTLCVAAAGNSGLDVTYPARLSSVLAVGAVGRLGWAPPGTLSAESLSAVSAGDVAMARFSPDGPELDLVAPGVGIVSTTINRSGRVGYGVMDGTSMACPMAVGVLARLMSRSTEYASLPRGRARSEHAHRLALAHCLDLGLPPSRQGCGLIAVGHA